ncbi:hypothetical protein [Jannaschia rubra]|uniref:Uncharacterized protein n=1 Tax=Jannaschia rubra TaxID=282197 RepID=A0A0M6XTX6_9RHOB|nr:hypothetical protein [Jannaschia rubra]CTQ34550.1 hypothetical protein JAN5088_03346 [Jannaschia rubra]
MRHRNLTLGGGALLAAFAADQASEALVVAKAPRLARGVPVLPAFNLAEVAVVCGTALLVLRPLFAERVPAS